MAVKDAIVLEIGRFLREKCWMDSSPEEREDRIIDRVLLFPPMNSYHRFLIHQIVKEQFSGSSENPRDLDRNLDINGGENAELTTFSVGCKSGRRCVVAFTKKLVQHIENLSGRRRSSNQDLANSFNSENSTILEPQNIHSEIFASLGTSIEIVNAKTDYVTLVNTHENNLKRPTILEIYGFPMEFKTKDLTTALDKYKCGTVKYYELRWVDDTHALVLIQDESEALRILQVFKEDDMKIRSLDEASKAGQNKASSILSDVLPFKPRPETSNVVARRMFHAALGIKTNRQDKNIREGEEKLRQARIEKRRISAEQISQMST